MYRYKAATAVTKDLVILLDGGNSMGDDLPVDIFISKGVTKFDTSINIIKALLDTLTYGDRVSVVLFSSSTEPYLVYNTVSPHCPCQASIEDSRVYSLHFHLQWTKARECWAHLHETNSSRVFA